MATGFMTAAISGLRWRHFTWAVLALSSLSLPSSAQEIGLAGILGNKALLVLNGAEPQAVQIGQSLDGVRLVSLQGEQATIEIAGKTRTLRVGQYAAGIPSADGGSKVVMQADGQGHFYTLGTVNGTSVRFLVDTGASMISLGASDARRIGLDPARGQQALSNTANGQVVVSRMKLDTVRIGEVTAHNVDALVHLNDMPVALLGMSFLNRMEMQRDGATMMLKKRY